MSMISVPVVSPRPSDNEALSQAAGLLRGFGDPTRLLILQQLAAEESRVVDLMEQLRLPQSTISSHLACLRGCGLVVMQPRGRSSVYSLAHPEVLTFLGAAEELAAAVGPTVALCPRATEEP